jgi:hemerythrin-like domain-containing protein
MPTRDQALRAYQRHGDYRAAGAALGVPAGQVYLAATGLPADGGDALLPEDDRPGALDGSTQSLVYGDQAVRSPTTHGHVLDWVKQRAAADAAMQAAAHARDAAPDEPQGDAADIVSVLTRQHDQVTALMKQLKAIPGVAKGGSQAHQSRRASIADMITAELSSHEAAEEEQFWPWVRSVLDDGDVLADTAAGQEQEGKDLLAALGRADASQERFDELAEELEKAARKHVAFEDRVLLKLRDATSPEDRAAVAERFLRAQRHAPARPHPRAPASPKAGIQATGRARDKAGDRPVRRRGRARSETTADSGSDNDGED